MRRAKLLVAGVVAAGALLLAPGALASGSIQPGIYDDAQILFGNPDTVFPALQQAGTRVIRVSLWWSGPALSVAKARPTSPRDPSDPAYDWATYDRTVTYASIFGMKVMFSIIGTPKWANKGRGWNVAPTDANDLRDFAAAAASRYSGFYPGGDGIALPRVPYWLAWNEPNNPVFLKPQFARVRRSFVIVSGRAYAAMCNAVVAGVKSQSRTMKVGCGVTAPRGNNNPNSRRASVSPLPFLRAMKAGGAKGFDAYAHHPYYGSRKETPLTPPPTPARGQPATAVTLGNFHLLTRELTRLRYRVRIWVTEYGYQTSPPDRVFGVTWGQQAEYMTLAYKKLRATPRVDMFIWFLLRDEVRRDGWQSGLFTAAGKRKEAREAFEQLRPRR